MFGGGGFGGGGYGGYGGGGGFGASDNDADRHGGGGGGGLETGGFNAVAGGGFGGGFGGAPGAQASQGLNGFLAQSGGSPDGQQKNQGNRGDANSLMPLTLKMLLDAYEQSTKRQEAGPDAPLYVNGREISMFTFVGCLESVEMQQIYKVFQVSDGTGRISIKQYHDAAQAAVQQEWHVGEYVRVFGTFRCWGGDFHVSAHNIAKVDNPNEVPFHFIEVAHTHLALAGRISSKAPAPAGAAQAASLPSAAGQQAPVSAGFPGQGAFGGGQAASFGQPGGSSSMGGNSAAFGGQSGGGFTGGPWGQGQPNAPAGGGFQMGQQSPAPGAGHFQGQPGLAMGGQPMGGFGGAPAVQRSY